MANVQTIEKILQRINKFITLDKTERNENSHNYDAVRNKILKLMKSADPTFKKFSCGTCIAGSYADNLKVSIPNEYDLNILLDMPQAKVEPDSKRPGYVHVNIQGVIDKCRDDNVTCTTLLKLVDKNGHILLPKFQSWFEGIFTKIGMHGMTFDVNDKNFKLTYTKTGPAHTCYVNVNSIGFSVDFVPGLVFGASHWLAHRPCPTYASSKWLAVPKPFRGSGNNSNTSFITSYVDAEREIIADKHNLKNTLRMIKKARDKLNVNNLKSYFIKTVYLWACDEEERTFWNQPASEVLTHMLQKIIACLRIGILPFYWDKQFNMLGSLNTNQIKTMFGQMNAVLADFEKYKNTDSSKIFSIFLTDSEIKKMMLISPL